MGRAAGDDLQLAHLLQPIEAADEIASVLLREGLARLNEPLEIHRRQAVKLRLVPRPVRFLRRQVNELVDVPFVPRDQQRVPQHADQRG